MSIPPFRIVLNGYGRVGRYVLRALYERPEQLGFEIVALNGLTDQASVEYLARFGSAHDRFPGEVKVDSDCLRINGDCVKVLCSLTPEAIDWQVLRAGLVLEYSGQYTSRAQVEHFLHTGASRVLLSQPMASKADIDATIAHGVNQQGLSGHKTLVSNTSCMTDCGVLLLKLLDETIDLEYVPIATVHLAMSSQPVIDAYHHEDLCRTRSAFQSAIPVSIGLARNIEHLLPGPAGHIQAKAIRVPTVNVSALDITLRTSRDTSTTEINWVFREAVESGPLRGLLAYIELLRANCDFNHDPRLAITDGSQTRVSGPRLISLLAWLNNERGFTNRMLDIAGYHLRAAVSDRQVSKG